MGEISVFESRIGKVACSDETFYSFITDIRSFRRFIPEGSVTSLEMDKDSCSFNVSMLGPVTIRISEKVPNEKVIFLGNALQINDFQITANILRQFVSATEVRISLSADLNPMLKMVAAEPVRRLLDTLITEMEKFRDWKTITEHNQFL